MQAEITRHYEKHYKKMVKLITYRQDGNWQDGEDIVHSAYERAIRYFNNWKPELFTFEAWFGKILVNCEKDFVSDKRRLGMVVDANAILVNEDGEEFVGDVRCEQLDEDVTDRIQDIHSLRKMILRKPAGIQKDVLLLYYIYQYGIAEIDSMLEIGYRKVDNIIKDFRISVIRG
jgi:RNA polymerase sigma factor (sigma-70 family)